MDTQRRGEEEEKRRRGEEEKRRKQGRASHVSSRFVTFPRKDKEKEKKKRKRKRKRKENKRKTEPKGSSAMSINQPLLQVAASGGSEGNNELAITVPRESEEKEKEEMASTDYNQCAEEFLQTNPEEGLSSEEAQRRLQKFGVNALPEEKKDPCMEFLGHFWGPMPIMIWVAIAIEILLACLEERQLRHLMRASSLYSRS